MDLEEFEAAAGVRLVDAGGRRGGRHARRPGDPAGRPGAGARRGGGAPRRARVRGGRRRRAADQAAAGAAARRRRRPRRRNRPAGGRAGARAARRRADRRAGGWRWPRPPGRRWRWRSRRSPGRRCCSWRCRCSSGCWTGRGAAAGLRDRLGGRRGALRGVALLDRRAVPGRARGLRLDGAVRARRHGGRAGAVLGGGLRAGARPGRRPGSGACWCWRRSGRSPSSRGGTC